MGVSHGLIYKIKYRIKQIKRNRLCQTKICDKNKKNQTEMIIKSTISDIMTFWNIYKWKYVLNLTNSE